MQMQKYFCPISMFPLVGGAIVKQLETQMVHVHSYTGIERAFLCKCLNEK